MGRCLYGCVTFYTDAVPVVTSTCWRPVCQYLGVGTGNANTGPLLKANVIATRHFLFRVRAGQMRLK